MVSDLLRRRAEISARMDPVAVRRGPSQADVMVRERAVLALFAVIVGTAVVFFGVGAISVFVDVRAPGEAMGLPGVAALVVLIICRQPNRRDQSLSRTILYATGLSALFGAIGVIAWPGPIQGAYWAAVLACVTACWALFFRWRTR